MNSARFYTRGIYGILLLALLASLAACASNKPGLNQADVLDRRRDGALAVFLDRKVTDSLDVAKGDQVDWKYVDVNKAGEIRVAVAFDDPDRIRGEVVLRDTFGSVIERQQIGAARGLYAFSPVNAVRGRYYIEIAASSGGSVYTVGVLFEEPDLGRFFAEGSRNTGGGGARKPPRQPGGVATGPVGGGGARRPAPVPDPEDNGATGEPGAPEEKVTGEGGGPEPAQPVDEEAGFITVSGSIQRVTPIDTGGTMLVIVISGAYAEQIKPGTPGVINGLGARVEVRGRSGNIARAYTKVDSEELQSYKAVTFRFKP